MRRIYLNWAQISLHFQFNDGFSKHSCCYLLVVLLLQCEQEFLFVYRWTNRNCFKFPVEMLKHNVGLLHMCTHYYCRVPMSFRNVVTKQNNYFFFTGEIYGRFSANYFPMQIKGSTFLFFVVHLCISHTNRKRTATTKNYDHSS